MQLFSDTETALSSFLWPLLFCLFVAVEIFDAESHDALLLLTTSRPYCLAEETNVVEDFFSLALQSVAVDRLDNAVLTGCFCLDGGWHTFFEDSTCLHSTTKHVP